MSASSECTLLPLVQSVQFKCGSLSKPASFATDSGEGVFEWSSGLQYRGQYVGRKRHGFGVQQWPDGARYEGHFHEDQRHGSGRHSWSNGEEYEGEYRWDSKHGTGTYSWPNGAHLTGQFRRDFKEGHCVYISADGNKFEGMYHDDVRQGEGVLTYPGGRQDVGTWQGTKLIQLTFTIKEAHFDPAAASCDNTSKSSKCSLGSPDIKERGNFGPKGQLEVVSEELIQAASSGNVTKVTSLVKMGAVHVDVADRHGHTALFTAAIYNNPDVINVLLDNGADVNKLDSVGISPLNAVHHILYCSLPQVKALLKLLPRLEYPLSQSSPAHSTALTDCTLHTSDFMSTPPSPHTLHCHIPLSHDHSVDKCFECQGLCGMHSSQKHFLNTGMDSIHQELNSEEESTGEVISVDLKSAPVIHTGLTVVERVTASDLDYPYPSSSPPVSTTSDQISLSSTLGHFDVRDSVTASVASDILGVSADSSEFFSLGTQFHGYEGGGDVSDMSYLSLQDLSEISLASPQDDAISAPDDLLDNLETNSTSQKCHSPLPGYLQLDSRFVASSVFSSTQYGPIVSAAQSTTLSCGSDSLVECFTLSDITEESLEEISEKRSTCVETIAVLLRRGADPNASSLPLPPLVYAVRSGDVTAVERLAERGADVNHFLPLEVGGHSPLIEAVSLVGPNPVSITEVLLRHGAQVNTPSVNTEAASSVLGDKSSRVSKGAASVDSNMLAGQNQGEGRYTPLHVTCAHRELSDKSHEELISTVLATVELLLGAGANVNIVAMGHSPLSLAILNGYDTVVERLLSNGGNPNLPLGRGVATALCCLVTVPALKRRDLTNSFKMVGQLLQHGADFTQPVKIGIGERLGSVTDFAYTALKVDKRLSCLKYSALNKSERARYRAWRKLLDNFVNLFRCKALHSIALRENAWLTVQLETPVDNKLQIRREKLFKTSSAIHLKRSLTYKKARHIHSAGGTPTKSKTEHLAAFPLHTLGAALRKVSKRHGPTLIDDGVPKEDFPNVIESSASKGHEKQRLQQLKDLFGLALEMFRTASSTKEASVIRSHKERTKYSLSQINHTTPPNQWTLSCFCFECGRCAVRLIRCPGCGYVYYCSQACRTESYKRSHRDECSGVFPRQITKTRKRTGV